MSPQPGGRREPLPLFQAGGLVREQARAAQDGQAPPTFNDLYVLDEQPLGEGRYSRVYGATHRTTGARRAIKTAYRRGENCTADVGMLCPGRLARHEADILKSLDHPNVVRIYEAYEEKDAVHLVLELCEGGDVLERILVSKGRLAEPEIRDVFVQMLFATSHLHSRGVVHRDLKPEHFLFTRRELEREPNPPKFAALKVIDFGLSHADGHSFVPLGGTPQFMPPEVIKKGGKAPARIVADRMDMWALGVVLHAMLVGHYPSPHLTDKAQAAYFAKSAWSQTSKDCLELLGLMLRQKSEDRPTAFDALQHPWSQAAIAARGQPSDGLVAALPTAIQAYYNAPGLQRIALLAIAHESDDHDFHGLRLLFQSLLQSGKFHLTVASLRAIVDQGAPWSKVAASLAQESAQAPAMYLSGGGADTAVDWKDFLAMAVMSRGSTFGSSATSAATGLPSISQDAAFRAFDTLALGADEVSTGSLRRLLAFAPVGELQDNPLGTSPPAGVYASPEVLDGLVEEMFPRSGAFRRSQMIPLAVGEIKPQLGGGAGGARSQAKAKKKSGGGLFACLGCGTAAKDDRWDDGRASA